MGVGGVRKGSEPCTGARVAIEDEMGFPVDVDLIAGHEFAECAGFYREGKSHLGGGERLVRNDSTFRDWSSNSASERRQPESRSYSSKAGQIRVDGAAVADRLAM